MTVSLPGLLIAGSCVSRDTYESQLRDTFRLDGYVARQSLISAMSGPSRLPEPLVTEGLSPFQTRMVQGDVRSSLMELVGDDGEQGARALLLDIVDERHGVYALADDGGFVTRSVEMIGLEALEQSVARHGRLLPFGSDEHFGLWTEALGRFLHHVSTQPRPPRVVALDIEWALVDENGTPTPPSFGVTAAEANKRQRRYLDELGRHELVRIARITDPVADSRHRWGAAAFHYGAETYARVADAVRACLLPAGESSA